MLDETLQIFDAGGNAIGTAPRWRVHREGLWHCVANVLLFRSDGRLIVQRRHEAKDVFPGAWDLSAAEHLKPGETYEQGAMRGLREELGVDNVALERVGEVARVCLDVADKRIKDYELQQSFRGVFDGEVRPDIREVREVGSIALSELAAAFADRPNEFTPWFRDTAVRLRFLRTLEGVGGPA